MNVKYLKYFKYSTYPGVLKDTVKDPVFLTYHVFNYGTGQSTIRFPSFLEIIPRATLMVLNFF